MRHCTFQYLADSCEVSARPTENHQLRVSFRDRCAHLCDKDGINGDGWMDALTSTRTKPYIHTRTDCVLVVGGFCVYGCSFCAYSSTNSKQGSWEAKETVSVVFGETTTWYSSTARKGATTANNMLVSFLGAKDKVSRHRERRYTRQDRQSRATPSGNQALATAQPMIARTLTTQ